MILLDYRIAQIDMVKILAFESSCDETAVALYDSASHTLTHHLDSQIALHAQYGGVVPELASRRHLEKLLPLTQSFIDSLGLDLNTLDYIAYTKGPGLVGSLLVTASFAKMLALSINKPLVPVHHLAAHVTICQYLYPELKPPYLSLLVSGGHSMILLTKSAFEHEVLGNTLDDAAGEAFDKGAKILGLGYPGGPSIAKHAALSQGIDLPSLPLPMYHHPGLDMSFSGLKTAFAQQWSQSSQSVSERDDFARALERTIVASLLRKMRLACKRYPQMPVVACGGVAANEHLRAELSTVSQQVYFPRADYCTDNAAMIAYQAYLQLQEKPQYLAADALVMPRWPLSSFNGE